MVITIIGMLLAILLPAIQSARSAARYLTCRNNLYQIWVNTETYRSANMDAFPSKDELGGWPFRMAYGKKRADDPRSLTETYGLHALFEQEIGPGSAAGSFVCPDAPDWMRELGSTYAFSIAGNLYQTSEQADMQRQLWVWENYSMYPGEPGWRGPFGPGYTVPSSLRTYPHSNRGERGHNRLYRDGHVELYVR